MPFRPKWVDCAWYHPHMGILLCIVKNILWKREKSWIYQCHTQMQEVNLTSFLLFKEALFVFCSFWLELACGLTRTVTEISMQCRREAWTEMVNNWRAMCGLN